MSAAILLFPLGTKQVFSNQKELAHQTPVGPMRIDREMEQMLPLLRR